jgi:hypothetical protein
LKTLFFLVTFFVCFVIKINTIIKWASLLDPSYTKLTLHAGDNDVVEQSLVDNGSVPPLITKKWVGKNKF